ncbi:unnamed protein product [Prorocentrum cordatum]|uniref:Uncharacterized protein n=1 Tax=Prorocentrum cordatum TaxID=2364126 RepID=A0ABN9YF98_9DINO|nr:unnamed protein product [Polarella glacialis]
MVQGMAKAKPRLGSVFAGGSDDEGPEYVGSAAWFSFPELGEDAHSSPARSPQRLVGVEAVAGPAYAQPSDEAICEFMTKWNLDERCERSLRSLSPRQQHEIMANFAPSENSKNTSAKFLLWLSPRLQQVEGRPPVTPDELRHFADKWGLDMRSRRILEELPPVVQCQVLTSFQPPPGTENVDAKLLSFARLQVYRAAARGRRRKGAVVPQERGRPPAPGGAEEAEREASPFVVHRDTGSPEPPRRGRAAPAGRRGPCLAPPPGTLVAPGPQGPQGVWWPQNLPQASWSAGAPPPAAERLWRGERAEDALPWAPPRGPPQLAPALLPPPPQWLAGPPALPQALPQTLAAPPAAPPPCFPNETVRAFVEHWGLDEKCVQSLLQLPAPQQQAVMSGFNPSKKTSNVNKTRWPSPVARRKM